MRNYYKEKRDESGLTREGVELRTDRKITKDLLVAIERETSRRVPKPDEIVNLADAYNMPEICNYYCVNECMIGDRYILPVGDITKLHTVIIQLLNSLNHIEDMDRVLIEITADSIIDANEVEKLVDIQVKFEELARMIRTLQMCIHRKVGKGDIDKDIYTKLYNAAMNELGYK